MDTNKFSKKATLTQVANVLHLNRLHNFHYSRGLEPTLPCQISTTEQNRTAFKFSTTENLQATLGFVQVEPKMLWIKQIYFQVFSNLF
jgi:hypothetical protein